MAYCFVYVFTSTNGFPQGLVETEWFALWFADFGVLLWRTQGAQAPWTPEGYFYAVPVILLCVVFLLVVLIKNFLWWHLLNLLGWGRVRHAAFQCIFIFVIKSENRPWRPIFFSIEMLIFLIYLCFWPKSLENEKKGSRVGKTCVAFNKGGLSKWEFPRLDLDSCLFMFQTFLSWDHNSEYQ